MRTPSGSCVPLLGYYLVRRASADKSAGAAGRSSGADARRETASRPRLRRSAADVPPDRSDRGDRAERGPRRLEPSGLLLPARPPQARARGEADALRARRDGAADERCGAVPGERRGVDGLRPAARVDDVQRQVPARHPEAAPPLGAARLTRDPGHVRRALGLDRLDERPQRHADARVHGGSRRDRDRRARRARAGVGSGGARLSEGEGAVGRGG